MPRLDALRLPFILPARLTLVVPPCIPPVAYAWGRHQQLLPGFCFEWPFPSSPIPVVLPSQVPGVGFHPRLSRFESVKLPLVAPHAAGDGTPAGPWPGSVNVWMTFCACM
jgi:hypothetical protein